MRIERFTFKFVPKYQLLIGLNVMMHETFDIKEEQAYDGVDIEFGLGLFILTIVLLKKKGAE